MKAEDKIIKHLKKENRKISGKYKRFIVTLEAKKIESNLGLLKGKYYEDNELVNQGSLIFPIDHLNNNQQPTIWDSLKVGESKHYGGLLDSKKDSLGKIFGDFFKRSFQEGRVQDFIPFSGKK